MNSCKNKLNNKKKTSFLSNVKCTIRIHLGIAYLAKTENILLKVLYINLKGGWNDIVGPTNYTKKCNGPINSSNNKLNSSKNKLNS